MLEDAGIAVADLDRVFVAGAFGASLNVRNAMSVGLLPSMAASKVAFVGNSSLAGARKLLLSRPERGKIEAFARRVRHVSLASSPGLPEGIRRRPEVRTLFLSEVRHEPNHPRSRQRTARSFRRRPWARSSSGAACCSERAPRPGTPSGRRTSRPSTPRYFEAGADVVSTNSFGGSRIKLAAHGLESRAAELNAAAARIAREAAPAGRFVAGSIGPTGKFLAPQGEFTEAEFEEAFAEQAEALARGGVDLFIIETQYDLREALAALRAARTAAPSLPVFVTLTFNVYPRGYFTLMGNSVPAAVEALEKEGASAVGANCTLDSRDMVGLVRAFRQATRLPVVAQANAGKPALEAGRRRSPIPRASRRTSSFVPAILEAGANVSRRLLRDRPRSHPEDVGTHP